MPVRPLKIDSRCKICQNDKRYEIDQLLYIQFTITGGRRPNGKLATAPAMCAYLEYKYGMVNMHRDNLRVHWRNHCEWSETDGEVTQAEREARDAIEAELGEGWEARILRRDEVLKILYSFESKKLLKSLISGAPLQGAAVERIVKMANELGKQGGSDSIDDLNEKLAAAAEGY
jgi:hypothetical protein